MEIQTYTVSGVCVFAFKGHHRFTYCREECFRLLHIYMLLYKTNIVYMI